MSASNDSSFRPLKSKVGNSGPIGRELPNIYIYVKTAKV